MKTTSLQTWHSTHSGSRHLFNCAHIKSWLLDSIECARIKTTCYMIAWRNAAQSDILLNYSLESAIRITIQIHIHSIKFHIHILNICIQIWHGYEWILNKCEFKPLMPVLHTKKSTRLRATGSQVALKLCLIINTLHGREIWFPELRNLLWLIYWTEVNEIDK